MKRISFDYDGTLCHIEEIQEFCKNLCDEGIHSIFIITRRISPENFKPEYGDEHTEVFELAKNLGIPKENVNFTNRSYKVDKIIELNIDLHIDDDRLEGVYIRNKTKVCTPICTYGYYNPNQKSWKNMFEDALESERR